MSMDTMGIYGAGIFTFYIRLCRHHNSLKVTTAPKTKVPGFIRKGKSLVFVSGCNKTFSQKTVNRILEEIRAERIKKVLCLS